MYMKFRVKVVCKGHYKIQWRNWWWPFGQMKALYCQTLGTRCATPQICGPHRKAHHEQHT